MNLEELSTLSNHSHSQGIHIRRGSYVPYYCNFPLSVTLDIPMASCEIKVSFQSNTYKVPSI